ncbi:MAG: hypothetical protein QOI04_1499 [Verrucomicrobiota bacterium]|jgi:hypothetical protein
MAQSLRLNAGVRGFILSSLVCGCWLIFSATNAWAEGLAQTQSKFVYRDASGRTTSVRIIRHYWKAPIVHPFAHVDPRIDPKLGRAATIAQERANAHSHARCWHYVKEALVAAGIIKSYPKTADAADAGRELVRDYGFTRLSIHDPYKAPIGAVLVYAHGSHGHVELRTKDGFVSDYRSKTACGYRLLAVYGKFSS